MAANVFAGVIKAFDNASRPFRAIAQAMTCFAPIAASMRRLPPNLPRPSALPVLTYTPTVAALGPILEASKQGDPLPNLYHKGIPEDV